MPPGRANGLYVVVVGAGVQVPFLRGGGNPAIPLSDLLAAAYAAPSPLGSLAHVCREHAWQRLAARGRLITAQQCACLHRVVQRKLPTLYRHLHLQTSAFRSVRLFKISEKQGRIKVTTRRAVFTVVLLRGFWLATGDTTSLSRIGSPPALHAVSWHEVEHVHRSSAASPQ